MKPIGRGKCPKEAQSRSITLPDRTKTSSIRTSLRVSCSGITRAEMPSIRPILAMLLPTTLPIIISGCPCRHADRLTKSSGTEVPNATTVRPIISVDMPERRASLVAPATRISPPMKSMSKPAATNSNARAREGDDASIMAKQNP